MPYSLEQFFRESVLRDWAHLISPWGYSPSEHQAANRRLLEREWQRCKKAQGEAT